MELREEEGGHQTANLCGRSAAPTEANLSQAISYALFGRQARLCLHRPDASSHFALRRFIDGMFGVNIVNMDDS